MITGAKPNTKVVKVEFAYTFEFIPNESYYIYVNVMEGTVGSQTLTFLSNLFKKYK